CLCTVKCPNLVFEFLDSLSQRHNRIPMRVRKRFDAFYLTRGRIGPGQSSRGDADGRGVGRNITQHYSSAADSRAIANRDGPQNLGADAHDDAFTEGWMPLASFLARAAKCHTLVERAIIPDDRRFAD